MVIENHCYWNKYKAFFYVLIANAQADNTDTATQMLRVMGHWAIKSILSNSKGIYVSRFVQRVCKELIRPIFKWMNSV